MSIDLTGWTRHGDVLRPRASFARGVVAGFTTKALGSMGGSATAPDEAARRRAALAARLGFDAVVRAKQVHGDVVLHADAPFAAPWPEADGLWTDRAGVLLGVVAADCVPVLAADAEGRVGAAHAGWEGTTKRIARRLVDALRDAGADPARMVATLGPSIGPCCYLIGEDRAAVIRARLGDGAGGALVRSGGAAAFDLWSANEAQLRDAGVGTVDAARICTRCGGNGLFSRRGGDVGLLGLAFIGRTA